MAEAINEYFIINGEEKNVKFFDTRLIKEGKSLYEVIRVVDGVPLFLEVHLDRLYNSAKLTNLIIGYEFEEIRAVINKLINKNNLKEGNVKIVFNFKGDIEGNNFLAYCLEHYYPTTEQYEMGVPVILYHGERTNPNAKVINTTLKEQVEKQIEEKKVYEAILVDRDGNITEGSKSNIFMVKGNEVITAPLESVLPGITRQIIIDICIELGIKVYEIKVNFNTIKDMEGLFISGTSPKVLPISKVNELHFSSSSNKNILSIMDSYNKKIENYIKIYENQF